MTAPSHTFNNLIETSPFLILLSELPKICFGVCNLARKLPGKTPALQKKTGMESISFLEIEKEIAIESK